MDLEANLNWKYVPNQFLVATRWNRRIPPQNDLTSLMVPNRPITTDLRHLSLTANNIMAKLTNQCTQTGVSTFDWQQPFTWFWWWLPLRLSKRQSPLPTTVLIRTTLTRSIKLHYCMLPPGSNHLLYNKQLQLWRSCLKVRTSLVVSASFIVRPLGRRLK